MLKYQVRTLGRGEKKRPSRDSVDFSSVGLKNFFDSIKPKHRSILENDSEDQFDDITTFDSSLSSLSTNFKTEASKTFSTAFGSDSDSLGSAPCQKNGSKMKLPTNQNFRANLKQSPQNQIFKRRGRSTSVSSLSSASTSSSEPGLEWGPIRIYTDAIRNDTTYCTLMANSCTTADDLVRAALNRLRVPRSRLASPQVQSMYYLTMELSTRQNQSQNGQNQNCGSTTAQNEVHSVLVLDPNSKPLELQACHPNGKSKFVVQARYTFPIKIYDYCISSTSNYKSLLVSQYTTCADVIKNMLEMHKIFVYDDEDLENFALVFVDYKTGMERILDLNALMFDVCTQIEGEHHQIHIKQFLPMRYNPGSPYVPPFYHENRLELDPMVYSQMACKFNEFVL